MSLFSHNTVRGHGTTDPLPGDRVGVTAADLEAVLRQYNLTLNVSRDELKYLLEEAERQAYRRRSGVVTCADIMSSDVMAVEYGSALEEAWTLMRNHKIMALPVVDRGRHVIGIVTQSDFIRQAGTKRPNDFGSKFRSLIRRSFHARPELPEVVGQIMSKPVKTVHADTHIVDLVPMLTDAGFHHLPVVDRDNRLVGMVTQSGLVAALYQKHLAPASRRF